MCLLYSYSLLFFPPPVLYTAIMSCVFCIVKVYTLHFEMKKLTISLQPNCRWWWLIEPIQKQTKRKSRTLLLHLNVNFIYLYACMPRTQYTSISYFFIYTYSFCISSMVNMHVFPVPAFRVKVVGRFVGWVDRWMIYGFCIGVIDQEFRSCRSSLSFNVTINWTLREKSMIL